MYTYNMLYIRYVYMLYITHIISYIYITHIYIYPYIHCLSFLQDHKYVLNSCGLHFTD